MATVTLLRVKLAGNWANNTLADIRFGNIPIGSPITVPQCNVWVKYPPGTSLYFTSSGNFFDFLNGTFIGQCPSMLSPGTAKSNAQATIYTGYGQAYVKYNVVL